LSFKLFTVFEYYRNAFKILCSRAKLKKNNNNLTHAKVKSIVKKSNSINILVRTTFERLSKLQSSNRLRTGEPINQSPREISGISHSIVGDSVLYLSYASRVRSFLFYSLSSASLAAKKRKRDASALLFIIVGVRCFFAFFQQT
jgi:hypothetical protein